ncbi:unnamed protein product, partial [Ectocarpus fasciculatus]
MAATDRDALVVLFHSTGGTSWKRNDNWNTTAGLSRWYGIKVDNQGRVVELRLIRNNLQGSIPKELGALTKLETLNLGGNNSTGSIPKELGDLTNLEAIHLGDNQLTGTIPKELGALTKLEELFLGNNQLTG